MAVKNEGWSPFDPSAWALLGISFGSNVGYKKKIRQTFLLSSMILSISLSYVHDPGKMGVKGFS